MSRSEHRIRYDDTSSARQDRLEGEFCITTATHARLALLVEANQDHPAAPLLKRKLAEARTCSAEEIDTATVTLNSRVRYLLDGDPDAEARILVHPRDYLPTGYHLSLLSPLGVALLGLTDGDEATYTQWDGAVRTLSVLGLEFQPERRLYRKI